MPGFHSPPTVRRPSAVWGPVSYSRIFEEHAPAERGIPAFFHSPQASEPPFFEWPKKHGPKKGHPDAAVSGHPALRLRDAAPEVH